MAQSCERRGDIDDQIRAAGVDSNASVITVRQHCAAPKGTERLRDLHLPRSSHAGALRLVRAKSRALQQDLILAGARFP